MGYNDNYRRGGYDRGGYRDYDRGYDRGYDRQRGGYPPPQTDYNDKFNNPSFPYQIGQKVIHKATGIELTVISYGREQLECRKPDLGTVWCYVHELDPVEGKQP